MKFNLEKVEKVLQGLSVACIFYTVVSLLIFAVALLGLL